MTGTIPKWGASRNWRRPRRDDPPRDPPRGDRAGFWGLCGPRPSGDSLGKVLGSSLVVAARLGDERRKEARP